MNRRELVAALAAAAAPGGAFAQGSGLRAAAQAAWLYGLPLIEMATTRARSLSGRGSMGGGINLFGHTRALAGPQSRAVTAPNNDTLYSSAWLDLTRGPVTLTIPPTGDRYISVAGMNFYSDNDFVLGTRTGGGAGGRYTIVGPGQAGSGPDVVRLSTPQGWLLGRTLVDGPGDLAAVHAVQDRLMLSGPAVAPPAVFAGRQAPAVDYFTSVAALLKANPPPATDGALFARISPLGLTADGRFDATRHDATAQAEIEAGVAAARAGLAAVRPGPSNGGWTYPRANLGDFGQDYGFRAAVALAGLAALPGAEAMYMNPVGDRGRMFTGAGPYMLRFPGNALPPVDAFWSLTMYEATPEGQFFLVENPLGRYSIGDRTPGLVRGADGSLEIRIARRDPGGALSANWLPAPASGPFTLSFRAYLPRVELLDGRYRLPAIMTA